MANAAAARVVDETPNEDETGQENVAEPSLRETLEAARDEVVERESGAQTADSRGGSGRDESGRFAKREGAAGADPKGGKVAGAPASAGAAEPAAAQAARDQPRAEAGQQPAAVAAPPGQLAPQGWSQAGKALWSTLPEAARAEISRREADMHRALTAQDNERQFGRELQQVFTQHQGVLQRTGVTPTALVSEFMQRAAVLQGADVNAKAAMLREIAQRHGIDARTLLGIPPQAGGPQPAGAPPAPSLVPLPPALAEMQRQVADMRSRWDAQQQEQQRAAQERQQREEQEALNDIMAFRSQPEIRFFDEVRDHMILLLNGNAATTLEEAYNQAIWARPDIRAVLQKEEADKQRAQVQQRQRVQAARAKSGSVRGGAGSSSTAANAPNNRTVREELQAALAEANSRV